MKYLIIILNSLLALTSYSAIGSNSIPDPSNGITYPTGWQNWATIAVSHRSDNNTIRAILGNDVAVEAARSGITNPWPDGAIIGKVVWKDTELKD